MLIVKTLEIYKFFEYIGIEDWKINDRFCKHNQIACTGQKDWCYLFVANIIKIGLRENTSDHLGIEQRHTAT